MGKSREGSVILPARERQCRRNDKSQGAGPLHREKEKGCQTLPQTRPGLKSFNRHPVEHSCLHRVSLTSPASPAANRPTEITMSPRHLLPALACLLTLGAATTPLSAQTKSRLASKTEPGSLYIEDILPKPVRLSVASDAVIYYQIDMQRALGQMASGTSVQLVAMTDTSYKVRGRARHGDVAGWMRREDLKSPDPQLGEKLKAFYERQKQVEELIANRQVALGMTNSEVEQSMGRPTRKSTRISAAGREDVLEYSIFDKVPQTTTGRDASGQLVQTIIYVKVEVGRLTVAFQNGAVSEINETMGNPLGSGGVKIVPGPITVY